MLNFLQLVDAAGCDEASLALTDSSNSVHDGSTQTCDDQIMRLIDLDELEKEEAVDNLPVRFVNFFLMCYDCCFLESKNYFLQCLISKLHFQRMITKKLIVKNRNFLSCFSHLFFRTIFTSNSESVWAN